MNFLFFGHAATLNEAKFLYNTMKGPFQSVLPNVTSLFRYLSDDVRTDLVLKALEYQKPDLLAFHFNDLDAVLASPSSSS